LRPRWPETTIRFKERRRSVLVALELVVERVAHAVEDVEADEVAQRRAGPSGGPQPSFMPSSMSSRVGEAVLVHAHRGHEVGDEQHVDDEAGAVLRADRPLAELGHEASASATVVSAVSRRRRPRRAA
jgi:hypothetical protein